MSHVSLLSSLTLFAASGIPFYFVTRVARGRSLYLLLSILLGLTLLVHGLHHLFDFVEMRVVSLTAGLLSALLAVAFGVLYYVSWRETNAGS